MSTLSGFHKKRSSFLFSNVARCGRLGRFQLSHSSVCDHTSLVPRAVVRTGYVVLCVSVSRVRVCTRVCAYYSGIIRWFVSSRLDVASPLAHLTTFPPASMALSSVPPFPQTSLSVFSLPPLVPPAPLPPAPALSRALSRLCRIAQSALSKCFTSLAINRGFGRTSPYLA